MTERDGVPSGLTPRADAWTRAILGPFHPVARSSSASRVPVPRDTALRASGGGTHDGTTPGARWTRDGAPSNGPDRSTRDATLDELRHVIRRIESRHVPRAAPEPIERVLGGALLDTGAGTLLVTRREYPLAHRHGAVALADAFAASEPVLRVVARAGEEPGEPRGLLFIDTETTGLAGGTGTYAFLVGVGAIEDDRFVVTQYFMRDLDEEPALLEALGPRLDAASGLVTFNGSGFDLPLLETRFILGRRRWPAMIPHVDLLRPARRVWLGHLADCRLATVEREALGLAREDDVPGAMIPALYFQFLRTRQARPLTRVFAHNRDDVLSLVALLGWFARALERDGATLSAAELAGLGRLLEPVDVERGLACYRAALERGLDGGAGLWTCLRLAAWEKRRERWDAACALWETAVRHATFDPRPWEELAKFHEHRTRNFATARELVVTALHRARTADAVPRVIDDFAYRLARLERRLAVSPAPLAGRGNGM
ncbi:MAG: ribonuclease H-like domain-containing protein [Candidatus Rokubacteria bacterium]|nr:ribonuclease H-like domain-containing protein [Candidatus Rokubacteria bacterium]